MAPKKEQKENNRCKPSEVECRKPREHTCALSIQVTFDIIEAVEKGKE